MENDPATVQAQNAATHINGLLKEYTAKLGEIAQKLRANAKLLRSPFAKDAAKVAYETDRLTLERTFRTLAPAIRELSRIASSYVDHAAISPALRIELRLRLAEIEAALDEVKQLA